MGKKLKDVINKNLKSPLVTKLMINYLSLNYNHLKKLMKKTSGEQIFLQINKVFKKNIVIF